jgi:hypothetical protein
MAKRKKPTDDETNENLNKSNESSDDTFGLPDIEYKPLDRVEETTTLSKLLLFILQQSQKKINL